jgi:hypothetical protein
MMNFEFRMRHGRRMNLGIRYHDEDEKTGTGKNENE